jgi:C4-dicarboxylate-binding protein DctP
MSWGEVPTALQQGVIDAIEVTPNAWTGSGVWELVSDITKTEYVIDFYAVATNKTWWDGLQDETRKKLKATIDDTTKWNWDNAQRINDEANEQLKKKGIAVHDLTPEQRNKWREAAMPVWKSVGYKLVGEDVVKRMQEIAEKHEN